MHSPLNGIIRIWNGIITFIDAIITFIDATANPDG